MLYWGENEPPPPMRLAVVYALLGLIATAANLLAQAAAARLWFGPWPVEVSMLVGTGIGLSIVEQIVTHHGGHIDVTSAPGKGSCFTMVVPAQ